MLSRVSQPSDLALNEFKKAGMQSVTPHMLTDEERGKIEAALAIIATPEQAGAGSEAARAGFRRWHSGRRNRAYIAPLPQPGMYDITLRASVIGESLTQFLTIKENRVFRDDGSGLAVTVTGKGTDALTYVLLHESSHVVDRNCGPHKCPRRRVRYRRLEEPQRAGAFTDCSYAENIFPGWRSASLGAGLCCL